MLEITIKFERMSELPIKRLLEKIGVYVLWDSQAKLCPSYIGEGDILKRLHDHAAQFARPIDGYVAITGDYSRRYYKEDAQIVEFLLLTISERIGQKAKHNRKAGSFQRLAAAFKQPKKKSSELGFLDFFREGAPTRGDRKLKVHLAGGFDPFHHPEFANQMKKIWTIEVVRRDNRFVLGDHPWRSQETAQWRSAASEL